jgi:pimeloyl-ACP methyl ester carboxylesterase
MFGRFFYQSLLCFFLFACDNKEQQKNIKIERDGVEISYTACGDRDTSLLFIHGWGINKEYWESQVNYFCKRYKVVAIDLPGFGKSGKNRKDWNFDEYAKDIKSVIDQLKLKNVILIGHSMSGDIVLNAGIQYPSDVIGLIGIDNLHEPGSMPDEQQRKETDSFFVKLSAHFDSTVNTFMKTGLFQPSTDPAIVKRVMNDVYTSDSIIAFNVLRSLMEISRQEQLLMKQLPYKLYLVNSDVFPTKIDSLNKYCKYGCEVVTVHGTGHYPMIEKPAEFNEALEKVLAKIGIEKGNKLTENRLYR